MIPYDTIYYTLLNNTVTRNVTSILSLDSYLDILECGATIYNLNAQHVCISATAGVPSQQSIELTKMKRKEHFVLNTIRPYAGSLRMQSISSTLDRLPQVLQPHDV